MRAECLERLAVLAERQHGVVAHRQLVALGFGRGWIRRQLETFRLHRVFSGVYAVGHAPLPGRGRWMAAVLACGEGAVLSHRSAAALWELLAVPSGPVDVLVERCGPRRKKGIAVHETLYLPERDRAVVDWIHVTSVPRTLLDLAEVAPARFGRAWDEAERRGPPPPRAVRGLCGRGTRRPRPRPPLPPPPGGGGGAHPEPG